MATQDGTKRFLLWLLAATLLIAFVYNIRTVLPPFLIGIMTAYFLDPAADRLEERGFKRGWATVIITVVFFTLLGVLILLTVPVLIRQAAELLHVLPEYLQRLQVYYWPQIERWLSRIPAGEPATLRDAVSNAAGSLVPVTGGLLAGVFKSGMAVVNLLSLLLITPLVAFYLIRDWDTIVQELDTLLPAHYAPVVREQMAIIDRTLAGFIRGQLNVCALLALYYALALTLIGLQFGFVIGLFTGFLVILPYVGFLFGMILAVAVGIFQFGFTLPLALVGLVYAGGQVIESYFLTPKLVGGRVGLHPLWVIFAILAGGAMFGFVGVLLAVPVAAIIGVLIRYAIERYTCSSLYLDS